MLAYCKLLKLGQLSPKRFTGHVVSILDSDTIEVLHNTHPSRIRLNGIDCPEKTQAFGARAKQATSAFFFGRDVILQTHGQDKYGRTLGDVFLSDRPNVNDTLVKTAGVGGIGGMHRKIWCWKG